MELDPNELLCPDCQSSIHDDWAVCPFCGAVCNAALFVNPLQDNARVGVGQSQAELMLNDNAKYKRMYIGEPIDQTHFPEQDAPHPSRDESELGFALMICGTLCFIGLLFFAGLLSRSMSFDVLWMGGGVCVLLVVVGTAILATTQSTGNSIVSSLLGGMLISLMLVVMALAIVLASVIAFFEGCTRAIS